MSVDADSLLATDIVGYLHAHQHKSLLRFLTCGSVDDGKSTLIGRLLYESHGVFDDQLAALESDSKRVGTQGGDLDFALLVDGLSAEREQGITIDVAYRYFATARRKFVVADTPGHEQYTRNMVTGASTADVAVILIDARKGVLTQTRRHTYLATMLGIRHLVAAVNKLDLLDYDQEVFDRIESDYRALAAGIGAHDITCIPVSALRGDNITTRSDRMPWYAGATLLKHLETVSVHDPAGDGPFRMPVQTVLRPDLDFRGFAGMVVRGSIRPGDQVRVLPSGQVSSVQRISSYDGDLEEVQAGQSATLVLDDEIDVSRGDVLCAAQEPPQVADEFQARVVWMHDEELTPGRTYLMKLGTRSTPMTISSPHYTVDVNTLEHATAATLRLNEIGVCTVSTDAPVVFEPYDDNRDLGGFLIIDRVTNATVGVGLIDAALRRSQNVHWQNLEATPEAKQRLMGHAPAVIWLTGLSGAGKSTIANAIEQRLLSQGVHTALLDGDNVRHGLSRDLGFSEADRVENIRRVAHVAALMADAGLVVLVSLISPFRAERQLARELVGGGRFCEVHVDATLEVAESRDVKGLYAKARRGELPHFTGIDSPYETPTDPEVHLDTARLSPAEAAELVLDRLRATGVLPS